MSPAAVPDLGDLCAFCWLYHTMGLSEIKAEMVPPELCKCKVLGCTHHGSDELPSWGESP